MNTNKKNQFPGADAQEKYKEAGVAGNDQNKAFEEAQQAQETPGHAEKSERGMSEFKADHGIGDEKPDCQKLSENGVDPSDRTKTEFP